MIEKIEGVWRRLRSIIGLGQVNIVDDTGPVQRHQVQIGYLETHDQVPSIQSFGFTSVPPAGSDVVSLFIGGERSNGLVLGTNHQTYRKRGLVSGESAQYDSLGKCVYLSADGIIIDAVNQPVTINNASTVTINASALIRCVTPRFECTGDIVDNCDTQTETMAGQRAVYDTHTHNVDNVEAGGVTRVSDAPNQAET